MSSSPYVLFRDGILVVDLLMSLTAALKVTVIMKQKCVVFTYIITLALLKLSLLPMIVIVVSNNLFLGDCLCSTQDFVETVSQAVSNFQILFHFHETSMSFCNFQWIFA